jgi:hypothetical protein
MVTNVALLLLALFVGAYYYATWPSTTPAVGAASGAGPYKPGERFDAPGILPQGGGRTLVLVLNTTCRYCNDSLPFYSELERRRPGAARLLAVSRETSTPAFSEHLRSRGFAPHAAIAGVELPRVRMTPTMILVSASAVVERVWEGRLNADQEKEVMTEWLRAAEH